MRRKQIATGDDGREMDPLQPAAPGPRSPAPYPGPPALRPGDAGWPGADADGDDETPPWERESGRIPVAPAR
jgi:hypothetical protein